MAVLFTDTLAVHMHVAWVTAQSCGLLLVFSDDENDGSGDYYDDDLYDAEVPIASVGKMQKGAQGTFG